MRRRLRLSLLVTVPALLCFAAPLAAQESQSAEVVGTPEEVVTELYDLVTFQPSNTPDWKRVRSLFLKEAVIVLRTSRTESTVFSLDGFVNDFVQFIERANVVQTGFTEQIISIKPWTFKDMAHVLVLYEASIPGSGRAPQQGVDSLLLVRMDGAWKIAAITNDIPDADHPIPVELRN
jgi:hypothetical protein